jgi:competence protein ComEC
LIISHGDADHIGGAEAVLDAFPDVLVVGQDVDSLNTPKKQLCQQNMAWLWDDVYFVFLSPVMPDSAFKAGKRNNRSCVLKVISRYGSALLTGDIEKSIERALVHNYAAQLASDILVVPHHGSNTSSNTDFIRAVNPKISLISVGYKNRYKLPSSKVIARYVSENRNFLTTSKDGAITIRVSEARSLIVERYREKEARYWHHNGAKQRVAINR